MRLSNSHGRFDLDMKGGGQIVFREESWNRKVKGRRCIMFAVIRHYHFNPKDGEEIDRRIREEFVPIVNLEGEGVCALLLA